MVDRTQPDDLLVREVDTIVEHGLDFADEGNPTKEDQINGEIVMEEAKEDQINGAIVIEEENMSLVRDVEVVVEPVRMLCRNRDYGCTETLNYTEKTDHEETCAYEACPCPLQDCSFVGSAEQLSLHFSSKHWDSGRRFQYNCPLPVYLCKDEQFLILQAEEDGLLFLLNKGIENIGLTVMITCIGPSSSKEQFFYDVVSERGISSLRLKSCTQNFPGRVEGLPPVDFLLIPFGYVSSSGQLNLEVCIWNSTELGAD